MKNTMRKGFVLLVLTALVVGYAFAQRVGDTWQQGGETYRVEQVNGDVVTVRKVTLDGTWDKTAGGCTITALTFSGSGAVMVAFDHNKRGDGHWHDAFKKGFIKVGDPSIRNIRSTSATTWTCEVLDLVFSGSNASGIRWDSGTITMQANGTIRIHSSIWRNEWDMILRKK